MGYDVRFRKTVLFSIGGAIAGLAGTLYASWAEIVTPGMFSLGQSAEIIIWCIVGGLGTLTGPVIGAMILAFLQFLLGQQTVVDSTLFLGLLLILSVLFLPRGVVPSIGLLWSRSGLRRRRSRHASVRRRPRGAANA
jgi:branched-chain amino acid transport system permease protein